MDDVRSNLTQDSSAWNPIKYDIDPTLGITTVLRYPAVQNN
jgi:hypothetical protein